MPKFRTKRRRDGSKYVYPVSLSSGRRRRSRKVILKRRRPMKIVAPAHSRRLKVKESLLSNIMSSVLHQTPIVRELHSAYIVADSIYKNWSLVNELYDKYKKDGWTGVVDSRAAHKALTSFQTSIIWEAVKDIIPERLHNRSLRILSTVVDKITDKEIEYVKSFLQENN